MKHKITAKQIFERCLLLAILCVTYYAATYVTGCPVRFLTGISCPGCGMTRALVAALRLDFRAAFAYHPLFILLPLIFAAYLFFDRIDWKRWRWLLIALLVLYCGVYLIRIIWFPDDIVVFAPQEGYLYRTFSFYTHSFYFHP